MAVFRIRELMEKARKNGKKVTQTKMAEKANVSSTSVWAIVNNETQSPDPNILRVIAEELSKALGREITINDLLEPEGAEAASLKPLMIHEKVQSSVGVKALSDSIKEGDFVFVPVFSHIPYGDMRKVDPNEIVGYMPFPKKLWEG